MRLRPEADPQRPARLCPSASGATPSPTLSLTPGQRALPPPAHPGERGGRQAQRSHGPAGPRAFFFTPSVVKATASLLLNPTEPLATRFSRFACGGEGGAR